MFIYEYITSITPPRVQFCGKLYSMGSSTLCMYMSKYILSCITKRNKEKNVKKNFICHTDFLKEREGNTSFITSIAMSFEKQDSSQQNSQYPLNDYD